MTAESSGHGMGVLFGGMLLGAFCAGVTLGAWGAPTPSCPAPDYDVDRVVKMHEESRKCAAELEEAQDAVRICGRLLKGALE